MEKYQARIYQESIAHQEVGLHVAVRLAKTMIPQVYDEATVIFMSQGTNEINQFNILLLGVIQINHEIPDGLLEFPFFSSVQ